MCRRPPEPGRTPAPWLQLSAHRRPRRPAPSPHRQVTAPRAPDRVDCDRGRAPTGRPNRGLPTRLADTATPGNHPATAPPTGRTAAPDHRRGAGPKPAGSARVQVSAAGREPATRRARRPAPPRAAPPDRAGPVPSPPVPPAARARGTGSAPSTALLDPGGGGYASAGPPHCGRIRRTTAFRVDGKHHIRPAEPDRGVSA